MNILLTKLDSKKAMLIVVGSIILLLVLAWVVRYVKEAFSDEGELERAVQDTADLQGLNMVRIEADVQALYEKFGFSQCCFGLCDCPTEDEDTIVFILQGYDQPGYDVLSTTYTLRKGRNLSADLTSYLTSTQLQPIRYLID